MPPSTRFLCPLLFTLLTLLSRFRPVHGAITQQVISTEVSSITNMAIDPLDGRIFVTKQTGSVAILSPSGALLNGNAISLSVNSDGERGLLGLAFSPTYATDRLIYFYYTVPSPLHNRVSRFKVNGDSIDKGSEQIILDLDGLSAANNHNGGSIHFSAGGKLYIGVGENADKSNSQKMTNLLGKMLRINADGTIPTDNPFYSTASGKNRAIWALGFRNPFTFNIHPNGRIFVNDVGESTYEEIDDLQMGRNYGWPNSEGPTSNSAYVTPFYAYNRDDSNVCSISGGAFYTGTNLPTTFRDSYLFGDYCGGWIKSIKLSTKVVTTLQSGLGSMIAIATLPNGVVLYATRNKIGKLWDNSSPTTTTTTTKPTTTTTLTTPTTTTTTIRLTTTTTTIRPTTTTTTIRPTTTTTTIRPTTTTTSSSTIETATQTTMEISVPTYGTLFRQGDNILYADLTDLPESKMKWWIVHFQDGKAGEMVMPVTRGSRCGNFSVPSSFADRNSFYRIYHNYDNVKTVIRDVKPDHLIIGTTMMTMHVANRMGGSLVNGAIQLGSTGSVGDKYRLYESGTYVFVFKAQGTGSVRLLANADVKGTLAVSSADMKEYTITFKNSAGIYMMALQKLDGSVRVEWIKLQYA